MEIFIPIDLTEEQKTIMAYLSMRQLLLIGPSLFVSLLILVLGNLPFVSGMVDFIMRFLMFLVINAVFISLAFIKLHRRDQFLSEFVVTKVNYLRSQKVYTN